MSTCWLNAKKFKFKLKIKVIASIANKRLTIRFKEEVMPEHSISLSVFTRGRIGKIEVTRWTPDTWEPTNGRTEGKALGDVLNARWCLECRRSGSFDQGFPVQIIGTPWVRYRNHRVGWEVEWGIQDENNFSGGKEGLRSR